MESFEGLVSPKKKSKNPGVDSTVNINFKTSVTCANVPEGLFEAVAAKKHFSKFGRVQRIRLFPKKQMCIIEYDQPTSVERAVLNAGAYDGFMFDVTRTKPRMRRKSKKEDDPDWVPDLDVEEELNAMGATPIYRTSRQKAMDVDVQKPPANAPVANIKRTIKQVPPVRSKVPIRDRKPISSQPGSGIESPMALPTTQTSMNTSEAALELHQLRSKVSLTLDEQWRTLDARDRILRAWGGAGSRVKVGGATIGTCPDMCPEKELLHRQAEHQVMTLETVPGSDGQLEPWRAVKQYSRSSADQEIPMCYELRPPTVLMRTCAYLLHEIADTKRQVSLADWFHFMWDRLRGIRKDITQQALCCAESIWLVEMCARFHAHCAARLADLEHTQFDQKLNTDNLTKCLQTLKHMYADVGPELKPREAEFRGYIALLNLGDANFWWEIKQLPLQMQKSAPITFAIRVFNALDNNNYVRFFRLVQEEATYLQACILLRYFNDVRARALARIVKAYAPRGGSKYPAEDLMETLCFESVENMKSFITHYGLRFAKDESELCIILDRHHFIEDSEPYPMARAINLIESKRISSVGQVIAGGTLPHYNYAKSTMYSSFSKDGKLKETALIAEDQGYNTLNDSNKDVKALKTEIRKLAQGGRPNFSTTEKAEPTRSTLFPKTDTRTLSPGKSSVFLVPQVTENKDKTNTFSFKPAIPVASKDIIKNSPEKRFSTDTRSSFSFSKPVDTNAGNIFKASTGNSMSMPKVAPGTNNLFAKITNENRDPFPNAVNVFNKPEDPTSLKKSEDSNIFKQSAVTNIFKKSESGKTVLVSQFAPENNNGDINKPLFANASENAFGKNIFTKINNDVGDYGPKSKNIFAKAVAQEASKDPKSVFGSFNKPVTGNLFSKPESGESKFPSTNGDVSPGTFFKNAMSTDGKPYSIFQSKNKASSVANNIFNSVKPLKPNDVYEFNQTEDNTEEQLKQQKLYEEQVKADMERKIQERMREEEEKRRREEELRLKEEEQRREEERRKQEEERRKQEELQKLEEQRRKEEARKQEALRKKLEEERKAEMKRKAEEEAKKFRERVDNESSALVDELSNEIGDETVKEILSDEMKMMRNLVANAHAVTDEICSELCKEISEAEIKAEKFWTEKVRKKWFHIWRSHFHRNFNRRRLLDDTPVWLPERTPVETASRLRRLVEDASLKFMHAIHTGYKFRGELKQLPAPEPYNIMEIIKSPLLKRMKQICYPYDKCFFWKVTVVSPGEPEWLFRKVALEKWLYDALSDRKQHESSECLVRVEKQSWNHLMDFAISISMTNLDKKNCDTAVEGTNGIVFYTNENDSRFIKTIEDTVKQMYPYQRVPVAVVMPETNTGAESPVEHTLACLVNKNIISGFRIFFVERENISDSLNKSTRCALKWVAKKYPKTPPLEVDYLKSICQRYLGNEIWYRLKSERDTRMNTVLKDLQRLVKCYNAAVHKLTEVITNEDLFNYPAFPMEFSEFLDHTSPYPKPFEFIPTNSRNSDNTSAIRDMMKKLMLPGATFEFEPIDVPSMQSQMRKYCKQIGWFEDPEEVVCKIVAKLPTQFADLDMPCEQFSQYFQQYDLIDFLNIIVYEKISRLQNFENRFAIYEKAALEEYSKLHWLYEVEVLSRMKHKPLDYEEDELDVLIDAKRRKIALDSMEYLMLEHNDCTMVEENIKSANETISKISNCKDAVKQLEEQIELEKIKSIQLENLLKSALSV